MIYFSFTTNDSKQTRIVIFNRFIDFKDTENDEEARQHKVKEARLRLGGRQTSRAQRMKILISFLQSENTTSPNNK